MRKKLDNISHGKPSAEPSSLKASQSSNSANIRTDVEETKQKLNVLAEKWKGVNSVKGFLTELWAALGIDAPTKGQQRGGNSSRYAAFRLQDRSVVIVTIRASAHNADGSNYSKEGNVNGDANLSLVLQKRWKKNNFKPSVNVKLDEYVYVDDRIKSVENPLTQIANSLIGYLTNGKYVDTTGVAITHNSPTIKESNTRNDMKQNRIKLTESQLKKMVSEAVKNVLREGLPQKGFSSNGNYKNTPMEILKALGVLGINLVDVQGGKMWYNIQTRNHYWDIQEALADLDCSELNELAINYYNEEI